MALVHRGDLALGHAFAQALDRAAERARRSCRDASRIRESSSASLSMRASSTGAAAEHRMDVGPRLHQADGELARPELVDAELAGRHAPDASMAMGSSVSSNSTSGRSTLSDSANSRLAYSTAEPSPLHQQREHPLARRNPCARQIKDRRRRRDQNLGKPLARHVRSHAVNAGLIHKNTPLPSDRRSEAPQNRPSNQIRRPARRICDIFLEGNPISRKKK